MLAAVLLMLAALAGTAAAQPTTTTPSAPPTTTTAPATTTPAPSTSAPATTTAPPTTSAPADTGDSCNGVKVLGACVPTLGGMLSSAAGEAAKDTASSFLSTVVDWVLAGFVWIMKYVIQLFMGTSVDVSGTQSAVQKMSDLTSDLQTIALGLAGLGALIMVLYQRAMLSGDNAAPEAVGGLVRWAIAGAMAAPVLIALSGVSDALATWIFTSAAGPEGPTRVVDALNSALSGRDAKLKTEDVISLALCILGLLAYLELMIQLVLQKFWIIYAAVALPIAGASSLMPGGKTVFWALTRAAVAALLFKPIAAIAFGVAFMQIRSLESGADVMAAVTLMVAPAFILPLLMQMIGTNVSYAGTPMLRGTIRNGRAGIAAGKSLAQTGGKGAGAALGAAGSGLAAAGRGASKAVPFIGAMGRAAAQTLTGPPPSRSSGGAGSGNRTTANASGSGTAPAPKGSAQGGSTGRSTASSTNAAASGSTTAGGTTGGRTSGTAAAPSSSSAARTGASAGGNSKGGQGGPPTRENSGRARNSTRAGASSSATGDGSGEHSPRPGRSTASSSTPRDSAFTRIT
ncbi:hypothetical protein [Nocardia yunnanensis]|uniref:hypothetical protein n=1 Tax=Nocardia yunnanensis TaxID=2382165 RepID=UPI0013C44ADF|nr:hypothetical protein [Nocardia yunnanensis]